MIETHQQFWNEWAETYGGFSEAVEPYREAQRELACAAVSALGADAQRETLTVLDVGGGAGNLIAPLLDALGTRRGGLEGVRYILTDGAEGMAALARGRVDRVFRAAYPRVDFRVVHADTLGDGFVAGLGAGLADMVVSSWNIEYYPPAGRCEIVARLVQLAHPHGVVVFSSAVSLPDGLTIRDVLLPLGGAQVLHSFLTGGPRKMNTALSALKQVARFGSVAGAGRFPEKPTLAGLQELADRAGLVPASGVYHLYGASAMVVGRRDAAPLPEHPKPSIARALAGRDGYHGHDETVSFWGYLRRLLRATAGGNGR